MTAQLKAQDDAAAIASQQAELKLQTALVEAERKASAKLESLREKIDALRDERDDLREQLRTLALLRMPGEDDAD